MAWHEWGRRVWGWIFGTSPEAHVRFVETVPTVSGCWIGVTWCEEGRVGGEVRDACDLVVGDAVGPRRVIDIAACVGRRNLPVDGWIVEGLELLPFHSRQAAAWLSGFARASRAGTILVVTSSWSDQRVRQLAAQVRQRASGVGRRAA